jgi:hypothetical protein
MLKSLHSISRNLRIGTPHPLFNLHIIGHGSDAVNAFDHVLGQELLAIRTNKPGKSYHAVFYRYRNIPGGYSGIRFKL